MSQLPSYNWMTHTLSYGKIIFGAYRLLAGELTFSRETYSPCHLHQEIHMKLRCNLLLKEVFQLWLVFWLQKECLILPEHLIWHTALAVWFLGLIMVRDHSILLNSMYHLLISWLESWLCPTISWVYIYTYSCSCNTDGLYLIEVDRVLRPGGYWILSGPPIRWKKYWRGWERTEADLKEEQDAIEDVAKRLCWKKVVEKDDLAIWQKPFNHLECIQSRKVYKTPHMCKDDNPDAAW